MPVNQAAQLGGCGSRWLSNATEAELRVVAVFMERAAQ